MVSIRNGDPETASRLQVTYHRYLLTLEMTFIGLHVKLQMLVGLLNDLKDSRFQGCRVAEFLKRVVRAQVVHVTGFRSEADGNFQHPADDLSHVFNPDP